MRAIEGPLLPMLLSSTVTNMSNGGTYGLASGEKIENPFDAPILIDEIRFHCTGQLADYVRCKLTYGRHEITSDYLPIDMFGRTLNWEGMHVKVPGSTDDLYTTSIWRLPKPLYLPSTHATNARITPSFRYQDDMDIGPETAATLTVTFAGRRLPTGTPNPAQIYMPYISSYHAVVSNGGTFTSRESDLRNPWLEDINVDRLIFAVHTGPEDAIFGDAVTTGIDVPLSNIMIQMHDSLGAIVLRDRFAIGDVMSPLDRSWPMNTVLRPGAYYVLDGEEDNVTTAYDVWTALHGTRLIDLADVGV